MRLIKKKHYFFGEKVEVTSERHLIGNSQTNKLGVFSFLLGKVTMTKTSSRRREQSNTENYSNVFNGNETLIRHQGENHIHNNTTRERRLIKFGLVVERKVRYLVI